MNALWKTAIWNQFGAAIEMLENAMTGCPDPLWGDRSRTPEFWYLVYHTLFWLDFYLSDSSESFAPPAPYTLGEMDPAGVLPDRVYTKAELQAYLEHGRAKCRATIEALTDERARATRRFGTAERTGLELLMYNMRHVQHHAAQLNLILRQQIDWAPRWVGAATLSLRGE